MNSKLSISLAAIALSLATATFAAAPAAGAPAAAAPTAKVAAVKTMVVRGTVVSSDAIANTIVVKGAKGEETFSIAPATKISLGKKDATLAEVTKDAKVQVGYTEADGAKTATTVKVSAAPAKKGAAAATVK